MADIQLPKERVRAKIKNPRSFILYSAAKQGKTSVTIELENSITLDTEGSTDFVDARKINISGANAFRRVCEKIVEEGRPYKYVIVDTVSAIEDFINPLAIAMYKAAPVGKNFTGDDILGLPNGGGYLWYRKAFFYLLRKAEDAVPKGGSLILVAHLRDKILKKGDEEVQAKDIDLTGKMKEMLCRKVDAIGYFYRVGKKGRISFQTSDMDNCGTRCRHLDGEDFLLSKKKKDGTIETYWEKIYIP